MIKVRGFRGEIPKLHPTLLPDGFAQVCRNARMRSGSLRPFRLPVTVQTLGADANSFVKIGATFTGYDNSLSHAVPGPVDDNRIYVTRNNTGGTANPPRLIAADASYNYALKLPSPTTKPTVAITSGTVQQDNKRRVVFAFTYVTSLGEESQPSPLSNEIDFSPVSGFQITLNGFPAVPSGRGITQRRFYVSETDYAGVTNLYYWGEHGIAGTSIVFDFNDELGEVIPSTDYDPPTDNLVGLTSMPNGIMAAYYQNTLFFCEPFKPHAWPIKYRLLTDYPIRGLAALGSSLVVATEGTPYIVQGTNPETMSMSRIEENLPCVSARGLVDLGFACAYPCYDGLVVVTTQGARLVTQDLFTREEWYNLNPTTFIAERYEGRYIFSYTPVGGGARRLGVIDLTGETPFFIQIDDGAGSPLNVIDLYYDIEASALFTLATNKRTISEFDAGASLSMTWRSKRYQTGALVNWPWARVEAGLTGSVTARLYGGLSDSLIHSWTVANDPVRLPAGRLDDSFVLELTGTADVFGIAVGGDPSELGA